MCLLVLVFFLWIFFFVRSSKIPSLLVTFWISSASSWTRVARGRRGVVVVCRRSFCFVLCRANADGGDKKTKKKRGRHVFCSGCVHSHAYSSLNEREKNRSGLGTRVMMMRRALSVGGNNNGRKDVVVDDDDNDDNDERVFDEKTTTRRSPRGDGSGVEEHHHALAGHGVSGEKSSSSPQTKISAARS